MGTADRPTRSSWLTDALAPDVTAGARLEPEPSRWDGRVGDHT